jgi:hypothetical protein
LHRGRPLGVAIAAVVLGGALAMHNEVTLTDVTHTPATFVPCDRNRIERANCRLDGHNGNSYIAAAFTTENTYKPGWVDPLAIVLAVAGVGFGLILIVQAATRRGAS